MILSLLWCSEMLPQKIKFNHFSFHLSNCSSCKQKLNWNLLDQNWHELENELSSPSASMTFFETTMTAKEKAWAATSVVMLVSHLLYILRVKEKNLFCGISLTKRAPFLNNYCFAVGTFIHIWTTKRHGMIMMDRSNFDCVEFIVLLGTLEKNDFTVDFRM